MHPRSLRIGMTIVTAVEPGEGGEGSDTLAAIEGKADKSKRVPASRRDPLQTYSTLSVRTTCDGGDASRRRRAR